MRTSYGPSIVGLGFFLFLTAGCLDEAVNTPVPADTVDAEDPAPVYSIGGTVEGLSGTVVLRNGTSEGIEVEENGNFTIAVNVSDGDVYEVTVLTQPDTQTCTVANGSGIIEGADVTTVSVVCSTNTYSVAGEVEGLSGTLVLRNNAGDDLELTEDGMFAFDTEVADGAGFAVTVLAQPSMQTCTVTNAAGMIDGTDVTTISVVCSINTYFVGGEVSGLSGTLVLQNNAGDDLELTEDGEFTFNTEVADGSGYAVTVFTQPDMQTCTVTDATGAIAGAAVANVVVSCVTNTYTVGGAVSGLSGTLVLRNNAGDDLELTEDGEFTFNTEVADGSGYAVTVFTHPGTQTCTVSNGTGMIAGTAVTNVAVSCATNTYAVGGAVSGLSGTLVLRNNAGDDLELTEDGEFTFNTEVADGSGYAVTVFTQPDGQTCAVSNGTGTVDGAVVTSVVVACQDIGVKTIYSTVTTYLSGNLGGITGADAKCMSDANYPGSGTYKALIVDGVNRVACTTIDCSGGDSEHVDWVLSAGTTYKRLDGTTEVFTANVNGIFVFTYGAKFTNGLVPAGDPLDDYLWTGLQASWMTSANTCEGWTSALGWETGSAGIAFLKASGAISGYSGWCDSFGQPVRLICVQQ